MHSGKKSLLLLLTLLGAGISRAQQNVQQQELAQIQGVVWNAVTNEPVRKALVTLQRLDTEKVAAATLCSANGQFLLPGIEPGRYRLWAERSGYVRSGFGAKRVGSPGTVLVVDPGQHLHDLALKVMPQSVITGRVFDADGDPVPDVHVQALAFTYVRGKRQLVAARDSITDDVGEYRIHGLSPSRYLISAAYRPKENPEVHGLEVGSTGRDTSALEDTYAPTYYPNSTDPAHASAISISGGEQVSNIDLTLLRIPTARIHGNVSGAFNGSRDRNVVVMLFPRDAGGIPSTDRNAATVPDGQGNFELTGVARGGYILFAQSAEGSARMPVDVFGSNVRDINLVIIPNLEVRGRLRLNDSPIKIADWRTILSLQPRDVPLNIVANTVKSDGTFLLSNVPPDSYAVNFRNLPEGYFVKEIRMGPDTITDGTLNLTGASTVGYLDVVLSRSGSELSGTVADAEANNVPGATVTLVPEGSRQLALYLYRTTTTDQYGAFSLRDIAPGEYRAYAWEAIDSGAYLDPDFLKTYKGMSVSVTIGEKSRANLQVKLIPAGSDGQPTNSD
jgi:hypothetical protein